MLFRRRLLLIALAAVLFTGFGCKRSKQREVGGYVIQAYYIPIGVETLTAVTSENIENRGNRCLIDSKGDIELLKKLIASGRSPSAPDDVFTNKGVRVKLIEKTPQGSTLLAIVENEGYVRRADGHDRVITPKDLAALKQLMENHCK